jgi:hypothetical protein
MPSQKIIKYMKQYGDKYAPQERKIEKGDLRKHKDRSKIRQAIEASCSDCILESWKEQEEVKPFKKKKKAKKT